MQMLFTSAPRFLSLIFGGRKSSSFLVTSLTIFFSLTFGRENFADVENF